MNILVRHSILLMCVLLVGILPYTSQAQTTTATSTAEGTATSSEPAPTIETPDRSVILKAPAQKRIINLAANISNRFDAIINRLQNISTRLNTRIEKLAGEGYDTTAASASLSAAETSLAAARTEMSTIDLAVTSAIGSQSPKTEWQKVRTKYISARDSIKEAHTELRATITNLKNAPVAAPAPVSASTTETI